MNKQILPLSFYSRDDVLKISRELLGKFLVTQIDEQITSGMIIEVEAYKGAEDKASHAYNNRRTKRTETMFSQGGVAYVYLCYGIHHLFNIVTASTDVPHAILIRAIEPVDGIPVMLRRRKLLHRTSKLCAGPGTVSQALGITTQLDGCSLTNKVIWLEDRGVIVSKKDIITSPRVGIDYAAEHRDLPWRFQLKNSSYTRKT